MPIARAIARALLASSVAVLVLGGIARADNQAASEITSPTHGWEASTPEEQGLDSAALARLVDAAGAHRQDSLLIVRHGKIVAEAYYAPYQAGIRHDLRSVTKSIIGTLTAIELQQGILDSVDHPILDLFSDKTILNIDENKKAMTVQNLLDMSSGLQWEEHAYTPDETVMRMYRTADHTQFVLDQPMANSPGTKFYYNGGNPYVLSAVITRKTGQNALEFAKTRLFGPLGIEGLRWGATDAQNVTDGESGLFLEPREMAKIGYLYLNQGAWEGKQIIPSAWVDRVKQGPITATYGLHYANFWWSLPERGAYMALGRHSQIILVLPKLDIVAVLTGALLDDEYYPAGSLIDAISASIKADTPLPPDPIAQSLLAEAIRRAATQPPCLMPDAPEMTRTVSGKSYRFGENALHVQTLSLNLVGANPSWEITADTGQSDRLFAGPIGLDGTFHNGRRTRDGIAAVKGRWMNDHTFEMDARVLGHGEFQIWVLRFGDKSVDISFENTDGFKTELHGEERESVGPSQVNAQ